MRVRWTHPGPDLFEAARSKDRARLEMERDARTRERDRRGRARRHSGEPFDINKQRLAEIVALIQHRHGGAADTDDADAYLRGALPHILAAAGGPGSPLYVERALRWCANCTPCIPDEEAREMIREAERAAVERRRSFLRADSLANLLRLTNAERSFLGIRTIGAVDRGKRQRAADRKAADRAYQAAKRAAGGATPQKASKSKLQPWKRAGMSRAKWYRLHSRETDSSATSDTGNRPGETTSSALGRRPPTSDAACLTPSNQPSAGPARMAGARRSVGADGPSPGAMTILVEAEPTGASRLSSGGRDDPRDFIGDLQPAGPELSEYAREGGIMPETVRRATLEAKRLRHMRQEEVARAIGISRPQLANALQGRFGLSAPVAASLYAWLSL